jgi:hypothetical protein
MQEIYCRPNESRQPYLRQTLQLTGLGCDKFQDGMDNMQHLHQILSRQVPEGAMEPLVFSQFGRYISLDMATRYFTSRQDDPNGIPMDFDQSTDPKGVLTSMTANGKYFHGEDNKVLYYRVGHGDNGEPPM